MKLITKEIRTKLLANGKASADAIAKDGNTPDHKPVLKLFTPDAQCTWLISEMEDDGDGDTAVRALRSWDGMPRAWPCQPERADECQRPPWSRDRA